MYLELFEMMGLDRGSLWSYEGFKLETFNKTTTYSWGYMELIVYVGDGKENQVVNLQFLSVPCKSIYNYIFGRPFAAILDVIASLVYLKLKFTISKES